jgi:hypothetical protein
VTTGVSYGQARRTRRVDLSRWSDRTALVAVIVAVVLALIVWAPWSTSPGDPSAVASDPRLGRCGGTLADVDYAFTIPRVSDYQKYIPQMPKQSELDLSNPALVVVYKSTYTVDGASPDPAADPDSRLVCIYVGQSGEGERNYYSGVSIAGLRTTPGGPALVPDEGN